MYDWTIYDVQLTTYDVRLKMPCPQDKATSAAVKQSQTSIVHRRWLNRKF